MIGARNLILNGLAQSDVDMDHHKLLNLDISNLPFPPIGENFPPTITPLDHFWLDGWDRDTQAWHRSQPTYSDLRPPTAPLSFANQRLINVGDAINPKDAMNLESVQNLLNVAGNLAVHPPVVAASTMLMVRSGLDRPVDGYTLSDGDRVLLKNQQGAGEGGEAPDFTRGSQNGIYIAHDGPWERAEDMDDFTGDPDEFYAAYVFVKNGDTQANTGWVQITPPPYSTDTLFNWVLFIRGGGGGTSLVAGAGLDISGNVISALGTPNRIKINGTIDIDPNWHGQSTLTTLGTVTTGVWQGAVVAGQFGGTGVSNTGKTITLIAGNLAIDWFGAAVPPANVTLRVTGPTDVQLPPSGLLASFPDQTGHAGEFLMTDGAVPSWETPFSVQTYLNVKNAPYFAKGDGTTDDAPAIQQAINDAGGNGVYLPKGTYYLATDIIASGACSLLGDGPTQSVLKANPNVASSGILQVTNNAYIRSIGVDGNLGVAVQQVPLKAGVFINGTRTVTIVDSRIANTAGNGITVSNSTDIHIMDSEIVNCAGYGVNATNSPRTFLSRCNVHLTNYSPIWFNNSPYSVVSGNTVRQGSPVAPGIYALDCDATSISGNSVQQCGFGVRIAASSGRGLNSYGINLFGNSILRNYEGGLSIDLCDGFSINGNSIVDNGQGGNDNNTYTVEPGVVVDPANVGSAYLVGDILTLDGGAGTPAKLLVTKIFAGGALYNDYKSDVAVWPITMGVYTTLPSVGGAVTTASGGHGTGAKFAYTSSKISSGGTGYSVGQVLKSTSGTFGHPVRVLIGSVDGGGAVKTYEILDGGGFSGAGLPAGLAFTSENPGLVAGSGFTLTPGFGRRYSAAFNGYIPYGVSTMGPMIGGIFGNNIITGMHYGGVAFLVMDDVSPRNGRASYLSVTGNTLKNNSFNFKGQTVGNPLDDTYNISSIFANNITYP